MITKERLEELIGQCATIYRTYADVSVQEVKLNKNYMKVDNAFLWQKMTGAFKGCGTPLEQLFETIEEAEWYRDFGCIEKIERLWFPTWESVYNDLKDYKDGDFYILDNDHFSFVYNKRYETSQLFLYTHNEKYNWNANKENYYEACKLAKSLFLGEKK